MWREDRVHQAQGLTRSGTRGSELACPLCQTELWSTRMGGGVGGDASGRPRLRKATQTLPKSLDFVRQVVLRSFKPRMSQWICPCKSGQVGEEGGVVLRGGGGRGGRGGRGLAITCPRRCLVAEGEVGTGMPAFDPEARGPRGVDELCADCGGRGSPAPGW